jgi:lipoyl(octanoyl) transferase
MATRARGLAPTELRAAAGEPLAVARLGTLGYHEAWRLQQRLVAQRQVDAGRDAVLLLEHPAVYTLGKRTDRSHVLYDDRARAEHGIELVEVDRGGDVTYHGPGQLVGYPILRLASIRGVVDYVRSLEAVLIRALAAFGLEGTRSAGFTGVWVGDEKIAAIGVRVASKGVTSHGFALNVAPDMTHFAGIVPCGIADRGVCSLASLGVDAGVDEVGEVVARAMGEVLAATLEDVTLDQLLPTQKVAT